MTRSSHPQTDGDRVWRGLSRQSETRVVRVCFCFKRFNKTLALGVPRMLRNLRRSRCAPIHRYYTPIPPPTAIIFRRRKINVTFLSAPPPAVDSPYAIGIDYAFGTVAIKESRSLILSNQSDNAGCDRRQVKSGRRKSKNPSAQPSAISPKLSS